MYEGSMVGKGSAFFAVWGYVISHMMPDSEVGSQVDLNPKLIAFVIGEKEEVVAKVIKELCEPDSASRSQEEQGRRLIKLGAFSYRVVNGAKYRAMFSDEQRREYNRVAQQVCRKKKKVNNVPTASERHYDQGVQEGVIDPHTHSQNQP